MQKKIIVSIIISIMFISTSLGVISYLSVNESIERALNNRVTLAELIANYIEILLQNNLSRLYDISLSGRIDLKDNNWEPEKKALESAYIYSLFSDGVFLFDKQGNKLLSYPPHNDPFGNHSYVKFANQVFSEGKPFISNIYTIEPLNKQVIFAMVPMRDKGGNIVGLIGGVINPTNPAINQLLQNLKIEKSSYIEIIDFNEIVVASDDQSRVLKHHDHSGDLATMIKDGKSGIKRSEHGFIKTEYDIKRADMLAFAPVKIATWGVVVGQPEADVFAPAQRLMLKFLLLAVIFILTSAVFAIGISRSIVKPVKALIKASQRIAGGDLSKPVEDLGSDEILSLGRSFDDMRKNLATSLEKIRSYSTELEQRVYERTVQLEMNQQRIEGLLKKIISSKEEEQKRIARELHDETLQSLSALLMNIEMCRLYPQKFSYEKIVDMKNVVVRIIHEVSKIVQNLRPSVLDDFGFCASIVWLLDRNLKDNNIAYFLNMDKLSPDVFTPEIEITLFRIVQESTINIARHSKAENVVIVLKNDEDFVYGSIEDNGLGFDIASLLKYAEDNRGLGVYGMQERAALLNGKLEIYSSPENGTMITFKMPLYQEI